jgi:hypothetical protein
VLITSMIFLAATAVTFFLFNSLGFMLVTSAVILLLTISYVIKYRLNGVGSGLAHFGLAYTGFGLMLLAIGLVQTHAGCMFLIGDCYQPTLPSRMFEIKAGVYVGLTILNGLALTFAYSNIRRTKRSSLEPKQNARF